MHQSNVQILVMTDVMIMIVITRAIYFLQDAKRLAKELLGQTVFAEWPHLKEVKVIAVSDGQYR